MKAIISNLINIHLDSWKTYCNLIHEYVESNWGLEPELSSFKPNDFNTRWFFWLLFGFIRWACFLFFGICFVFVFVVECIGPSLVFECNWAGDSAIEDVLRLSLLLLFLAVMLISYHYLILFFIDDFYTLSRFCFCSCLIYFYWLLSILIILIELVYFVAIISVSFVLFLLLLLKALYYSN